MQIMRASRDVRIYSVYLRVTSHLDRAKSDTSHSDTLQDRGNRTPRFAPPDAPRECLLAFSRRLIWAIASRNHNLGTATWALYQLA